MTEKDAKQTAKTSLKFVVSSIVLIFGITLILLWWPSVVIVFKGALGILFALAGLFTLYSMKQ